ncbi:hypothetical protein YPPY94_4823, partial [Yersinia pestis PY-94]
MISGSPSRTGWYTPRICGNAKSYSSARYTQ